MSVYDDEAKALAERPKTGGKRTEYDWLDIPKPASKGQKTSRTLRIVPRLAEREDGSPDPSRPYPQFWIRVAQHNLTVDGANKGLVCPDDHDRRDSPKTCPLCVLANELRAANRRDWDAACDDLRARQRIFVNVVDIDGARDHWKEDGAGGWLVKPKVYAYGESTQKDIITVCQRNGPVEDVEIGRNLFVDCERIGPQKRDVRYHVTASDPKPLPPELLPVAYAAHSLEGLRKAASLDELRDLVNVMDPRGARSSHAAAPPPAATPPAQAYAPPPPAAPAPPARGGTLYHYAGASGQKESVDAVTVARFVIGGQSGEQHHVWADGMPAWAPADSVPEIQAAIAAQRQPAAPPAAPPGYAPRGGYPVPPPPPGRPQGPPQAGPPGPPAPPAGGPPQGPPRPPSGAAW